jgi:hypothetical protein
MTIELDEYRECLERTAPELRDTLESEFHEAARIMSPAGLKAWLDGARALCELGRGKELLISYIEEMPAVVKECGDDIINDVVTAAMKLSSMTSGEVIALLFASLPTAARRLGDPELLRGYLALIHRMSARAPRGLRYMLMHIDELLSKLTLSGLRRWADFGAQAYKRDFEGQIKYFSLQTEDSRAMLQKERRGTLFVDVQRKLNFYLRALWGRDFFLRPSAADYEGFRPYLEARVLHLPDAVDDVADVKGLDVYRAMAAHMAAHMMYTREPISAEALSPAQMWFIGLAEDARVEYCAAREFPGLGTLWRRLMAYERTDSAEHPSIPVLERVALALGDPDVKVGDEALDAIVARFHERIEDRREDTQASWHLGLELYNEFAARRAVPSLRVLEKIRIPYRDDNRFLWDFDELAWQDSVEYVPASQRQVRKHVSLMEFVNEVDVETAGDDAQEVWILSTELFPYEDEGISYNEMEGKEPVSDPYHYHEWDYQVQLHRPDWVTVYERRQPRGNPEDIDAILAAYKPVTFRIKQIIDRLRPEGVTRQRKLEDGDDLDINLAVDAMIDIRMGRQPDPRVMIRHVINQRDLAIVILLDLSESTNEKIGDSEKTVLELTREACALVSMAISGIGDAFAIHGFASDGRHDVHYYRFKDFDQPFDDEAKSRLAGMQGGLSTRMGAAMRHAAWHLSRRPERRKLLLLVTDGEPADIDERDPQYLRHDTKKAAEELHTRGITTYCLTLDPNADQYVQRIFGVNHYTIIDHVDRLPEKLPMLFASLTR